jgi:hypothetical protein
LYNLDHVFEINKFFNYRDGLLDSEDSLHN